MTKTPDEWTATRHAALIADGLELLASEEFACLQPFIPGLERYLAHRIETGGFLRRVLENDFEGAMAHAHPTVTTGQLRALAMVLFNGFPAEAWGSPEKVAVWLADGKEN